MMGLRVKDPHGVESALEEVSGLGLLEMETEMFLDKITSQVEAVLFSEKDWIDAREDSGSGRLSGYEIHMGRSVSLGAARPLFRIISRGGHPADIADGLSKPDGRVWGTYIHGIFDNDGFRRKFLNDLQKESGRAPVSLSTNFSYKQWKEEQYDRLANHVRNHTDVKQIYRAMGID
jgi:adenosylcobyric acid synthase